MSESQLGSQTRAACFGQDTSRLYEREDGKKPWRAETPAGPHDKAAAKAGLVEFHEAWHPEAREVWLPSGAPHCAVRVAPVNSPRISGCLECYRRAVEVVMARI